MTPTFVAVLPAIMPDLARRCIASMAPELRSQLLLVDNTGTGEIADEWVLEDLRYLHDPGCNLGVAGAWNFGLGAASYLDVDYLLLLSQSIRFGRSGGGDFLMELEQRQPEWIMHAQFGWKLIAVARRFWSVVGHVDHVFWPAYYEESDLLYRAHLLGLPCPLYNDGRYDQVTVDAVSAGDGVAFKAGVVALDYGAQLAKYVAKWGGGPCEEKFARPYDDPALEPWITGTYRGDV